MIARRRIVPALSPVISLVLALALSVPARAQWIRNGTPACNVHGAQNAAALLADGAGGCFVAWHDRRAGNWAIWAQHFDTNGFTTWGAAGLQVCAQPGDELSPQIVTDGAGGCIIVWLDSRSGAPVVYGQRLNATGTPQWNAAGVAFTISDSAALSPLYATSDRAGGVIAAWRSRPGPSSVYVQRVSHGGSKVWKPAAVPACPGFLHGIDSDGSGGVVIASLLGGGVALGQRVGAAGSVMWGPDGEQVLPVVPFGWQESKVRVAGDGTGGAYFVYVVSYPDNNATFRVVTARRMDGHGIGVPGWVTAGQPLPLGMVVPDNQSELQALGDGAGGLIAVDLRGPVGDGYVTAFHATPGGFLDWVHSIRTANWEPYVVDAIGAQVVADGFGGALALWGGIYFGNYVPITAIRLDRDGVAPGWSDQGVVVDDQPFDAQPWSICNDHLGGAIVAFTRSGDVLVSKVRADGFTVGVDPPAPTARPGLALLGVSPNPTPGPFRAALKLTGSGETRLELFDVQGREVFAERGGRLGPGSHIVEVSPGDALPAGMYLLRVTTGGERREARVVVAH